MSNFEELEEKLKAISLGRKPASAPVQKIDETRPIDVAAEIPGMPNPKLTHHGVRDVFELPESTRFADESVKRVIPTTGGSADKVVGGRDPDYSGYDDLINNIPKQRDTSTADLISMGVATGIGALFGQAGVGAKSAGAYGTERFNKAEKRGETLDDMIFKLKIARAQQMAKGAKGTKIKGTSGSDVYGKAYQNRYIGKDGLLRTPQVQNEVGQWIQDENDPVAQNAQVSFIDQKSPDGSVKQLAKRGHQVTEVGAQNAEASFLNDAKGNITPINKRTALTQGLPEEFNKTDIGTTKTAKEVFDRVNADYRKDTNLARYQQANSDLRAASAALGSDGELSPSFLLAAQRFLGMGMDKGRSLTNDEFAKVEGVNSGVLDRARNAIIGYKEGKVGSEQVRAEYRKLTALLSNNVASLRNERIADYNSQLQKGMGKEFNPKSHSIAGVGGISGNMQESDVKKADKLSSELRSEKPITVGVKRKDGTTRKVQMGYNPKTKKYDRYIKDL